MTYARRILDDELDVLFADVAAIAIDGPKAVGKTTSGRQRAVATAELDDEAIRVAVTADPRDVLRRARPLLIDEWQRVPAVWDVVRRAVDDDPEPGQFLLTGSATPQLGSTAHSGAGRIGRIRMRPMTLSERGVGEATVSIRQLLRGGRPDIRADSDLRLADYVQEIVGSGYPGMRDLRPRARRFALDSYLHNVVDRDVPEQGLAVRKPAVMMDWMRAYAAASATTASYTAILDAATSGQSAKPARSTGIAYRDVLTQLWILDPVPSWGPLANPLARLQETPKHHLADPALACRLLGVGVEALLGGEGMPIGPQAGTLLGHLFESLVTLCVRVAAQAAEATVGHLRTRNGDHEVDLVVVRDDGKVLAIEVKLGGTVQDSDGKHLRWLADRLGPRVLDSLIITTGPTAYRRRDGIGVIPLAALAP